MNQRLCILAEAADIPFDFISLWEFDFISLWDPELQQSSVKLRCQTESPQLQQLSRFMLCRTAGRCSPCTCANTIIDATLVEVAVYISKEPFVNKTTPGNWLVLRPDPPLEVYPWAHDANQQEV